VTGKIANIYSSTENCDLLCKQISKKEASVSRVKGLRGSSVPLFSSSVIKKSGGSHLFILNDKEEAAYFLNDLESFCQNGQLHFFPSAYKRSVQFGQKDPDGMILRTGLLNELLSEAGGKIIVTYPEALSEKVVTRKNLANNTLTLKKGEKISIEFTEEVLTEYGFTKADFVYSPGEYSVRGSIVDIFPFSAELPSRLDFFGDEVDSIREFDIESQLSKGEKGTVSIVADVQDVYKEASGEGKAERESFFSFIGKDTVVWINDAGYCMEKIGEIFESTTIKGEDEAEETLETQDKASFLISGNQFSEEVKRFRLVEFGHHNFFDPRIQLEFNTSPQPAFNKNFELLTTTLAENSEKGYSNYIFSENEKQFERLKDIFIETYGEIKFTPVHANMHAGFTDHDLKICCFTDHQIFERYHKYRLRSNFTKSESLTLKELHGLHPGDYVVHADHGIGIFGGIEKININEKVQESVRLVFKDNDLLFVSIHSLHRISKYKGKDGVPPKIYKLGSGAWKRLKDKARNKVKDIARELIVLYAKRKKEKGFAFSPDSYLQKELEASFLYEDTPDQLKATNAVKEQMESDSPMDILVCGDVGFGKTEVAIRAAFKAVADNKQVAVLVPTTILAMQHYNTFMERLKDFPCKIEYVSRMKSPARQKEIVKKAESGEIDIVIGTHRLIRDDVHFKDLGLLVIDEEQKFGVSVKEKLKKIKLNVDTLTLTATPIPRTLQFSLMGARDLSIINTPPPNRHPILTELHTFNHDIIREAITYEVQRGGQVFFIHNRVQNIEFIENLVQKLCPGVKTVVAHGQMKGNRLEQIMLGFISGKYDVLISTNIIESGLDIPNANSIIINNAHHFGLSDLHQLRGRVGRSNIKAFCYLLAPPLSTLTKEARSRLKAVEDFSELGSGFNIAMQDLDIRGAGNLLGREQSGFITDMGLETYQRIINEALEELKTGEFAGLFRQSEDDSNKGLKQYASDCQIDTDLEILFPDSYIPNVTEKLNLYRQLDNIESEEGLEKFEKALEDRFGKLPLESKELLNVVRLRWTAMSLGFEKVILKNERMVVHFISNKMSQYYQSSLFAGIIMFLQKQPDRFKIKESKNRLSLTVEGIKSVKEAMEVLETILQKAQQEAPVHTNH